MADLSQFPAGTLLSEMVIDLFGNKQTGEITVLYDRPFRDVLLGLQYSFKTGELLFIFEQHGPRPFGKRLESPLKEMVQKVDEITLLQVNKQTNRPVHGMTIPLEKN